MAMGRAQVVAGLVFLGLVAVAASECVDQCKCFDSSISIQPTFCLGGQPNTLPEVFKFHNCTIIVGNLLLVDLDLSEKCHCLPHLRHITGFLVLSGVTLYRRLSDLLPCLQSVYGFQQYNYTSTLQGAVVYIEGTTLLPTNHERWNVCVQMPRSYTHGIVLKGNAFLPDLVPENRTKACPGIHGMRASRTCPSHSPFLKQGNYTFEGHLQVSECPVLVNALNTSMSTLPELPPGYSSVSVDDVCVYNCTAVGLEWRGNLAVPCIKTCSGDRVDTVNGLCDFIGCQEIVGPLGVEIRVLPPGRVEDWNLPCQHQLQEKINSVEGLLHEVFKSVKTVGSFWIGAVPCVFSLDFLSSLETISCDAIYGSWRSAQLLDAICFSVWGMPDLEDISLLSRLTYRNAHGLLHAHNNPMLCESHLSELNKSIRTRMNGRDLQLRSGDNAATAYDCSRCLTIGNVTHVTESSITMTINDNGIGIQDNTTSIWYDVQFLPIKWHQIDMSGGHTECGMNIPKLTAYSRPWCQPGDNVIPIIQTVYNGPAGKRTFMRKVTGLRPNTPYALLSYRAHFAKDLSFYAYCGSNRICFVTKNDTSSVKKLTSVRVTTKGRVANVSWSLTKHLALQPTMYELQWLGVANATQYLSRNFSFCDRRRCPQLATLVSDGGLWSWKESVYHDSSCYTHWKDIPLVRSRSGIKWSSVFLNVSLATEDCVKGCSRLVTLTGDDLLYVIRMRSLTDVSGVDVGSKWFYVPTCTTWIQDVARPDVIQSCTLTINSDSVALKWAAVEQAALYRIQFSLLSSYQDNFLKLMDNSSDCSRHCSDSGLVSCQYPSDSFNGSVCTANNCEVGLPLATMCQDENAGCSFTINSCFLSREKYCWKTHSCQILYSGENPSSVLAASLSASLIIVTLLVLLVILLVLLRKRSTKSDESLDDPCDVPEYVVDEWELPEKSLMIFQELGEGAFGTVYKGLFCRKHGARKTDIIVAIKTLKHESTSLTKRIFLQEASVMKKIHSEHIVQLIGIVSKSERPLVVMEFMAYGDLKTYLNCVRQTAERPEVGPSDSSTHYPLPSEDLLLQWATQLASGMLHLFQLRFVHRDLAARNCMLTGHLHLKVGDFGLTRDIYQTDYYRQRRGGMMPVRWLPPEALRDGLFTPSTDVWSYGVVLWEMATLAARPYPGKGNSEVLDFIINRGTPGRPPPNHFNYTFPKFLIHLMERCWRYCHTDRITFEDILGSLLTGVEEMSEHGSEFGTSPLVDAELQPLAQDEENSMFPSESRGVRTNGNLSRSYMDTDTLENRSENQIHEDSTLSNMDGPGDKQETSV